MCANKFIYNSGIPNRKGYCDEDSFTISSFFSLTILSTGKSIFILFKLI